MFAHYKGLAHIALRTVDVEKSIEFYEKIGGKLSKTDSISTEKGDKTLALLDFAGVTLELIQVFEPVESGVSPHFAVYVDDLSETVAEIMAAGIDSYPSEKIQQMHLFGGITNWFLNGPGGEQIEFIQA